MGQEVSLVVRCPLEEVLRALTQYIGLVLSSHFELSEISKATPYEIIVLQV